MYAQPQLQALPQLELRLPATGASASRARKAVAKLIATEGVDKDREYDIMLALGEAVSNAIEHAYQSSGVGGHFTVRASTVDVSGDRELIIQVSDEGNWRPSHGEPNRGHGMMIMESLTKDLQVQRSAQGTSVRLTFSISPPVDLFVQAHQLGAAA